MNSECWGVQAMRWLTAGALPGDAFFFHFSGHGSRQRDKSGVETDGFDETILPVDFRTAGHIIDDEVRAAVFSWQQADQARRSVCCRGEVLWLGSSALFDFAKKLNVLFERADALSFGAAPSVGVSFDGGDGLLSLGNWLGSSLHLESH